jgi:hypothetical protein
VLFTPSDKSLSSAIVLSTNAVLMPVIRIHFQYLTKICLQKTQKRKIGWISQKRTRETCSRLGSPARGVGLAHYLMGAAGNVNDT